jgi:peptide deformylase
MSLLPIIWAPDPILKTKCTPVTDVDDDIRLLLDDMLATMYDAPGVGLAAPQIGVTKRVLVIDVTNGDVHRPYKMVNPEVVWASDELATYEEGCLSLPKHYADVERSAAVTVEYLDEQGERQSVDAEGLFATCVQHEIDHLDGILFVDHLSALKRNMILRKMVKAKKQRDLDDEC